MVLENMQTTVAYRCPHCGAGVMSLVGIFNLSADMLKLKCSCGHSEMTVVLKKDGQVRFTVPCILCPKPHNYTVSSKIFFGKELFVLPCPYSDINICMMGESNHVKAELARTELELLDLMEEHGISDFAALHEEAQELVSDPQVLEILMFVIRDLDAEGKIYCRCDKKESEEGDFEVEVTPQGVCVTCRKCGATKTLPAGSLLEAHDFLNADSLRLE